MLKKYFEAEKAFETEEQKIQTRINEVISKIFHHLKLDHYHQDEWLAYNIDNSFIYFGRHGDWPSFNRLETDEIDYNYKIPTRFLSMKNEDIFLEIDTNINKKNIKKLEKENTRKTILKKLTDEEKKVLEIY